MKGRVPRVVVAKYEDNTPRTKKVMIKIQVCGRHRQRQRRRDYNNTFTLFFSKKKGRAKNGKYVITHHTLHN
jgi:hypothetical protein